MNVTEALNLLAVEARRRYREQCARAGRIKDPNSRVKPLQVPSERAAAERTALAYLAAAERIERISKEE